MKNNEINLKSQILRIGTASWGIPTKLKHHFPEGKSLLERYSHVFNSVEINSSFYRSHQRKTYARWAAVTPANFLFAVKMPQEITHKHRLVNCDELLTQFINEVSALQNKLGPLLIQLPPSLDFKLKVVDNFLKLLRIQFSGHVAVEARHVSWAASEAVALLEENNIVQVIADPVRIEIVHLKNQPFQYYRLHGSPEIYSSSYQTTFLHHLKARVDDSSFIIFDNTKQGAATQNALELKHMF